MKPWLSELINPSQLDFVAGRSIFYNVIMAHEVAHSMHIKRFGTMEFIGAKLDMSKAYDRDEWPYVVCVMSLMVFPERWTNLIFECMSTVPYALFD